jgi:hypothetical protein
MLNKLTENPKHQNNGTILNVHLFTVLYTLASVLSKARISYTLVIKDDL